MHIVVYHSCFTYIRPRRLIAILIFLTTTFHSLAQSPKIDSLQRLANQSSGEIQVDILNQLAYEWLSFDNAKANEKCNEALQLSKKLSYEKGLAQSHIYKGLCEFLEGNHTIARLDIIEGLHFAIQINDHDLQGYALLQLGNSFLNQGKYDSSLYYYNQTYEILKDSLQPINLSNLFKSMGRYYGFQDNPKLQEKYYNRSLAIREKLGVQLHIADILVVMASMYITRAEYEKAILFLKRAEDSCPEPLRDPELVGDIQHYKAIIFFRQGDFERALPLYESAKNIFQKGFTQKYITQLIDLGEMFEEMSNYEVAFKNLQEALKLAEIKGYEYEQLRILIELGWVYYHLNQDEFVEEFAEKTIKLSRKLKLRYEESAALNLKGVLNTSVGKYREALDNLSQALVIRQRLNSKIGLAETYFNLGILSESQNNLKVALPLLMKSLAYEEEMNHRNGIAWSWQSLAEVYSKMGNNRMTYYYLNKADALSSDLKVGEILIDNYKLRRDLLERQGNYKESLHYSKMMDQLKDSIHGSDMINRFTNLQRIYEVEKKDQEIKLLDQDKQLQQDQLTIQRSQLRQQRIIIVAAACGLILILGVAYILYLYFRRMAILNKEVRQRNVEIQIQSEKLKDANGALVKLNLEIYAQQKEIQVQAEDLAESNQTISKINQNLELMVDTRTTELHQAYKELDTFFYRSSHDFRRPLTTFMGLAEVAKITIKDSSALELFDKVNQTARSLDKMLIKLQSISEIGSQELVYKEIILNDFLDRIIDSLQDDLERKKMTIHVDVKVQNKFYTFPTLLKIVIENLIENAIQFNGRKDPVIRVKAFEQADQFVIEIIDNGLGIEEQYYTKIFEMYFRGHETSKGNGLGLYIVRKIIDRMGGAILLYSVVGEGTTFQVRLPLAK